jgi:transposase
MNVLHYEKRRMVIQLLVEGNSIRSIERITGVHRDTIMRLMVKAGTKARALLDERMRGLKLKHLARMTCGRLTSPSATSSEATLMK